MSYQMLTGWPRGLDVRKSLLTSPVGALVELQDCFVNSGEEIEKRKAFIQTLIPNGTGYAFGLQATNTGLLTFGSAASATVSTAWGGSTISASGFSVGYQQLAHPDGSTAMTGVVASCAFKGRPFVLAQFGVGGKIFPYYDGTLVRDFTDGIMLAHITTKALLATALAAAINAQGDYTASQALAGDEFVTISAEEDKDFELSAAVTTAGSGDLTVERLSYATAGMPAAAAVAQFEIYAGSDGYHAGITVGIATAAIALAADAAITIAGRTYTFKTALTPANNEIMLATGGTAAENNAVNALRLARAINWETTGDETDFYVTSAHATVYVPTLPSGTDVTFLVSTKLGGIFGNSLTAGRVGGGDNLTPAAGTLFGSGINPSGGDFGIFRVVVNGVDLIPIYADNLDGSGYANGQTDAKWLVNNDYCAALTAAAINATSSNYRAENDGPIVRIFPLTAGDTYNGYKLEVWALGKVCVGKCALQFTGKNFDVNKLWINGIESIASVQNFDVTTGELLSDFVSGLSDDINTGLTTDDYISVAIGETLYISRLITKSDDLPIDVQVDINAIDGGAVTFLNEGETTPGFKAIVPQAITVAVEKPWRSDPVAVAVSGGVEPFKYRWERTGGSTKIGVDKKNQAEVTFSFGKRTPANTEARFHCVVTDNDGKQAVSNEIVVRTIAP